MGYALAAESEGACSATVLSNRDTKGTRLFFGLSHTLQAGQATGAGQCAPGSFWSLCRPACSSSNQRSQLAARASAVTFAFRSSSRKEQKGPDREMTRVIPALLTAPGPSSHVTTPSCKRGRAGGSFHLAMSQPPLWVLSLTKEGRLDTGRGQPVAGRHPWSHREPRVAFWIGDLGKPGSSAARPFLTGPPLPSAAKAATSPPPTTSRTSGLRPTRPSPFATFGSSSASGRTTTW